jgi:fructose-1-phosphate kinase PfkB-like protein
VIRCLALSPSLDVVYETATLEVGGIVRPTAVHRSPGGKALNVARTIERLGTPVSVIALLGGHLGELVREQLTLPVEVITLEAETRMCVTIAADGALTEIYEPATPIDRPAWDAFVATAREELDADDWAAISGSVPAGIPLEELTDLVVELRARGVKVAIDTHGPALRALVAAGVDLVKINRAESVGLAAASIPIVVITDGAAGSVAQAAGETIVIAGDPVRGAYPVGSGDAYFGGLLHGLDAGVSLPQALRFAAACASANAAVPAAGSFSLTEVESAFERIGVS